jgi:predicted phosphodiesterase
MKIFVMSDIHIGKLNKTEKIVANIISFFIKNRKELSKVYAIVFTGDVFDRLLATTVKDYKLGLKMIGFLVSFCKQHDIKLRILEGTPSHDHRQVAGISDMIAELDSIDYKYVDTLHIEYIDGMTWLYLPDKYKDSGEEIQEAIKEKLLEHKLDKVDFIFAHGNFSYQIPIKIKSALDENYFLSITNYYIVIGHVHNRSVWKRILCPGSFDRLEVNQEIAKGGLMIKVGKTIDDSEFEYMDNENAMKFDTLDLKDMNVKEAYKLIRSHSRSRGYDEYDHLRIKTTNEIFSELKERLDKDGVLYTLAKFKDKEEKIETTVTIDSNENILDNILYITPNNIVNLLSKRDMIARLPKGDMDRMVELLQF